MTAKRFNMTAKRFTIEIDDENFAHILDNGTDIGQYNLCKLLNGLHKENQSLLRKNGAMEEEIECLSEENDELKKDIQEKEEIIELYQGFCGKFRG